MKIRMSIMFQDAEEIDRKTFFARYDYKTQGELTIHRTTGQGQHREMKVASFRSKYHLDAGPSNVLYEPVLEYMNDGKFVLSGFERKEVNGKVNRYAQSWLCRAGWEDSTLSAEKDDKQRSGR